MGSVQNLIKRLFPYEIITYRIADLNNQLLKENNNLLTNDKFVCPFFLQSRYLSSSITASTDRCNFTYTQHCVRTVFPMKIENKMYVYTLVI